jgi:hypothetical protein
MKDVEDADRLRVAALLATGVTVRGSNSFALRCLI